MYAKRGQPCSCKRWLARETQASDVVFRVPSWAMRVIVQRRLGLPLDEALARGAPTCTARGGKVQDPMGDAASNIGRAGHNQRHKHVLHRLVLCMQSVWGRLVEEEPQDHLGRLL